VVLALVSRNYLFFIAYQKPAANILREGSGTIPERLRSHGRLPRLRVTALAATGRPLRQAI
jgi:hypothetical protein